MNRSIRLAGVILAFALLLVGTVLVFQAFDRNSHSASDTLRPFLITMFPVWLVAIAGAWALLRPPAPSAGRNEDAF
jgi:lipopolysaccharide export LptBFGC system permease protein LptF